MSIKSKDLTPPPTVREIGPYTIFVTPPPTPSASAAGHLYQSPPEKVQPPPQQFHKPVAAPSEDSAFGFPWNAVAKVQRAHSSLDEYMAHWFGLNQSMYQWALDDYYENKEMVAPIALGKLLFWKLRTTSVNVLQDTFPNGFSIN